MGNGAHQVIARIAWTNVQSPQYRATTGPPRTTRISLFAKKGCDRPATVDGKHRTVSRLSHNVRLSAAPQRYSKYLRHTHKSRLCSALRWQTEDGPTIGAGGCQPCVAGQPCSRPGTSSRRTVCLDSNVERGRISPRNERSLASRAPSALQLNSIGVIGSRAASQTVGAHLGIAVMVASHSHGPHSHGPRALTAELRRCSSFRCGDSLRCHRNSP
jgi:hypothetical protein